MLKTEMINAESILNVGIVSGGGSVGLSSTRAGSDPAKLDIRLRCARLNVQLGIRERLELTFLPDHSSQAGQLGCECVTARRILTSGKGIAMIVE